MHFDREHTTKNTLTGKRLVSTGRNAFRQGAHDRGALCGDRGKKVHFSLYSEDFSLMCRFSAHVRHIIFPDGLLHHRGVVTREGPLTTNPMNLGVNPPTLKESRNAVWMLRLVATTATHHKNTANHDRTNPHHA